jgi:hypothetical protein
MLGWRAHEHFIHYNGTVDSSTVSHFFTACSVYFGSFIWHERYIGEFDDMLEKAILPFCRSLGLLYTCVRAPRS